ncbi:outer membrane protein [Janthinobacterium sp. Marseille]|uniref:Efflux transporter outer membrane subunit n=1 Tax=Herminiimonas aquatilis TaxID=345342 RepID=A0ABW2J8Y4_9BURK|nr:efflux transporter outer membrane subunit [Janthinobacterium sp. Marseille]ABR91563.1 outer membrane protein [Janthinobacterium sp. Marseille]
MKSFNLRVVVQLSYATVLSSILVGCSLAPVYERPDLPVSKTWPDQRLANERNSPDVTASEIDWKEFFIDQNLSQVIQIALNNNRDLRVAALNIDRARALYGVQGADRLPSVGVGTSGARQRTPADLNDKGFSDVTSTYSAGIGITSFELDFFGRIKNLSQAALERYIATDEARRSAQIALISEVAMRYQALAADHRLWQLANNTLSTRLDSHARQQSLLEQGASSELDLRQSESLLEAARVALAQQTRQRAVDQNALRLLVGATIDPSLLPSGMSDALPAMLADIPVGLPSDLISTRPDIRQHEAILRSENASIGAARAAFFPRISLTGSLGTSSSELSGLFEAGSRSWSFLPQVSLPIFDVGRNRANLNVAKADRDIAIAEYEKSIQIAFREVADALAGTDTLKEELRASTAQERAERVRYVLSKQRYESGYASYLEFLDAQRSLFAIQQKTIVTELAEMQNKIGLYKALGGGWK